MIKTLTVTDLGITKANSAVVAEKKSGKPKFTYTTLLYANEYYRQYRAQRGQSGFHVDHDGQVAQLATDADVLEAVLAAHGLTHETALALAKDYERRHYAGDPAATQYRATIS